jgi:hypothetical protein
VTSSVPFGSAGAAFASLAVMGVIVFLAGELPCGGLPKGLPKGLFKGLFKGLLETGPESTTGILARTFKSVFGFDISRDCAGVTIISPLCSWPRTRSASDCVKA